MTFTNKPLNYGNNILDDMTVGSLLLRGLKSNLRIFCVMFIFFIDLVLSFEIKYLFIRFFFLMEFERYNLKPM